MKECKPIILVRVSNKIPQHDITGMYEVLSIQVDKEYHVIVVGVLEVTEETSTPFEVEILNGRSFTELDALTLKEIINEKAI